jgi:hypothetical protein
VVIPSEWPHAAAASPSNQRFDAARTGVSALVALAVIAKSAYSVGPQGELFRGTVSRNLEMSDRIDSRFSFYVVQAAAHHQGPASPTTEKFFAPWTFFSRGPLAGLLTTPIVMATNGQPPTTLPENRWSPYDVTGFCRVSHHDDRAVEQRGGRDCFSRSFR